MNPPAPETVSIYKAKNRKQELVGGGWFVFRRGRIGGRVKPSKFPFEHPTHEAALREAMRLAGSCPGERFVVLQETDVICEVPDVADEPILVAAE